jgi:hypothetical protein
MPYPIPTRDASTPMGTIDSLRAQPKTHLTRTSFEMRIPSSQGSACKIAFRPAMGTFEAEAPGKHDVSIDARLYEQAGCCSPKTAGKRGQASDAARYRHRWVLVIRLTERKTLGTASKHGATIVGVEPLDQRLRGAAHDSQLSSEHRRPPRRLSACL